MKAARLQTRKQAYEREIARLASVFKPYSDSCYFQEWQLILASEVFHVKESRIVSDVQKYWKTHKEEDVNEA